MRGADTASRLIDHLPALYRSPDAGSELPRLLAVLDELLFSGQPDAPNDVPGIERAIDRLPALFAPLGEAGSGARTPDRFLPWIASWLAFTPHALFEPDRLRNIVAGIVPLHGRRGTRAYLEALLTLCFDEEIVAVQVDERDLSGLRLGHSRIGVDTLLAPERPFWFGVDVQLYHPPPPGIEQRLRAVIEFGKPAHTAYELRLHATVR